MLEYPMLTLLVIAPFAERMQQAERQRQAVEAIWKAGGYVLYDYEYDESGKYRARREPPAPAWLMRLVGEDFICSVVDVYFTGADDEALENVRVLTNLESLYLSRSPVTDRGIERLTRLTRLTGLTLLDTPQVTMSGLEELGQALPNCKIVWIEFRPGLHLGAHFHMPRPRKPTPEEIKQRIKLIQRLRDGGFFRPPTNPQDQP